ncbi:MAG: right-handed parallel beta-helix repeat-containing protein [Thermoflexales bacterium]|nr:right-handed parallel beta-helix repeat-containing protein [Thermoflexales bacterium]
MRLRLWLSIGLAGLFLALVLGLLTLSRSPVARAAGGEIFIVDTSEDEIDEHPGNCTCRTLGGKCTLRAAIQEANACSGSQTIKFSGPMWITPTTPLPALTDNGTVIDGSDWWQESPAYVGPGVRLRGTSGTFSGLVITASNCAIYGLEIREFAQHGVYLYGGARNNVIGGAGTHQSNIIWGNGQHGVLITGSTTTSNTVAANYIGTCPQGFGGMGNGWHGVSVWYGGGNVITGNWIASNGWSGVAMDYVGSGEIRNNRIGLMGTVGQLLGNKFYGIHIAHGAMPVVISNTIAFNGRGIHVEGNSSPWIYSNLIYGHNASAASLNRSGSGGGIFCENSSPIISANVITNNVAYTGTDHYGYGGGIALWGCSGSVIGGNLIVSNTANAAGEGYGGGLFLSTSSANLLVSHNTIMSNTAGFNVNSYGGGLHLRYGYESNALITSNVIRGNRAAANGYGFGGGLHLFYSGATVDSNIIIGNHALHGGALSTANSAFFTATNNFIAHNSGSGVYCWASPDPSQGLLVHNTIVQNDSSGVELRQNSSLTLTNNIIVSHTACGITAWPDAGNSAVADYTLFFGNGYDTGGGAPITSTHAITGRNPLFLDPAAGNYHLRAGSPAVNAGIAIPWLTADIDGDPRPIGAGYDIGADEYIAWVYLPLVLRND